MWCLESSGRGVTAGPNNDDTLSQELQLCLELHWTLECQSSGSLVRATCQVSGTSQFPHLFPLERFACGNFHASADEFVQLFGEEEEQEYHCVHTARRHVLDS